MHIFSESVDDRLITLRCLSVQVPNDLPNLRSHSVLGEEMALDLLGLAHRSPWNETLGGNL